ncbi:TraU family protein [Roseomonas sp. WGS1072]|uniref:TraU family protein n=1 Tax=Roseomonas sp. WGS1072 TaxID=3366816 RepID=UPI003BF095F0
MALVVATACFLLPRQSEAAADCPDSQILGTAMITDICWECIFPIRVAGATMAAGGSVPRKATDQIACLCSDGLGVPHPGITVGMWMPSLLLELVRAPGCSPSLGGINLPGFDPLFRGGTGDNTYNDGDGAYWHYHTFAFPVMAMLELFVEADCLAGGMQDFDLLYISELDPTWSHAELAFFANPEAAVVADPAVQAACTADAAAALTDEPIDELFWCAGSWGGLYPFVGTALGPSSPVRATSLLATRALAAQHRRGLAWRTMGNDALCRGVLDPMIPKSQYRLSMMFPLPEANGNHPIGRSTFAWGEHRNIPGRGPDPVYLVWRWTDCCMTW